MSQDATEDELKEACAHLERSYSAVWVDTKSLAALFHVNRVTVKKRLAEIRRRKIFTRQNLAKQGRPREWSIHVVCQFLHDWRLDADLFHTLTGCAVDWWKRYPGMVRAASGFRTVSKIDVRIHYAEGTPSDAVELSPHDLEGDCLPNLIRAVRRRVQNT